MKLRNGKVIVHTPPTSCFRDMAICNGDVLIQTPCFSDMIIRADIAHFIEKHDSLVGFSNQAENVGQLYSYIHDKLYFLFDNPQWTNFMKTMRKKLFDFMRIAIAHVAIDTHTAKMKRTLLERLIALEERLVELEHNI